MKKNYMILCYDYDLSKFLANCLSEKFSIRFLDEIELFNFDFSPMDLNQVISLNGSDFVLENLSKSAKSHCDYEGIIFLSHLKVIEKCYDFFSSFKENDYIIFISGSQKIKNNINITERKLDIFSYPDDELEKVNKLVSEKLADISLCADGLTENELAEKIIEEIYRKNFILDD